MRISLLAAACFVVASAGCARAPSPLAPHFEGSIGVPHHGVLTRPAELPREGDGYRWLTTNDRHYGVPRFVAAIERAASSVARERPGSTLAVGDLSAKSGGRISHHSSHRTGRDVDLLLYLTTLDGAPVESPGFVQVGVDGLGWDERGQRFLRVDVEREWLLVKSLVEDPEARVQWIFVSRPLEAMLIEWARARGESADTIVRAMDVMLQPAPPAQAHDDHVHVRTACEPAEIAVGCEPTGPERPWIAAIDVARAHVIDARREAAGASREETAELLEAILQPIGDARASAPTTVDGPKGGP